LAISIDRFLGDVMLRSHGHTKTQHFCSFDKASVVWTCECDLRLLTRIPTSCDQNKIILWGKYMCVNNVYVYAYNLVQKVIYISFGRAREREDDRKR
jgi:hypothetical protein